MKIFDAKICPFQNPYFHSISSLFIVQCNENGHFSMVNIGFLGLLLEAWIKRNMNGIRGDKMTDEPQVATMSAMPLSWVKSSTRRIHNKVIVLIVRMCFILNTNSLWSSLGSSFQVLQATALQSTIPLVSPKCNEQRWSKIEIKRIEKIQLDRICRQIEYEIFTLKISNKW